MVDLTRFPLDPMAVAKMPKDAVLRNHILPLMIDGGRLIVAVDRPSRIVDLRSLHIYVQTTIVPVLASGTQIGISLERMSGDLWRQHAAGRAAHAQVS